MTRIFDNIKLALGSHLVESLEHSHNMDVAVGYFNLRGWRVFRDGVAKQAEKSPQGETVARILIGMSAAGPQEEMLGELQNQLEGKELPDADAAKMRARRDEVLQQLRTQLSRGLPSDEDRETLRQLREQVAAGVVQLKVFTRRPLHGKTYLFHTTHPDHPTTGFVGSSNLTSSGLASNLELNVDVLEYHGAARLREWFEERWNDKFSRPINEHLLGLLDESWANPAPRRPYEIFVKVCYDMSRDVREGLAEYGLPPSIRHDLLTFQINAVQTLARRIMSRGGTMLGDVVGLGKTLTAVATSIMLREEHGFSTLVVCPKNLVKMWNEHLDAYDIPGRVVHYNTAARDLPSLRRYQFVIVDESHTLRNDNRQDYQAIRSYIVENDCKVLLLTGTPYNIRFLDVANQLGLFIDEDDDLGIQPTNALRATPQIADRVDNKTTTLRAFRYSEDADDWKRLMSEHLVRRTRSFVKTYYAEKDEGGREFLTFPDKSRFFFPERIAAPLEHSFGPDDPAALMASDSTLSTISSLKLPRYNLADYLRKKVKLDASEAAFVDRLQRGRGQVAGFVRINFFKRLSSGGHSFVLSLKRHVTRNQLFLYAIRNDYYLPTGTFMDVMLNASDIELEETEGAPTGFVNGNVETAYEALLASQPSSVTWVRPTIFNERLEADLQQDTDALVDLLGTFGEWTPDRDSKLARLIELANKQHPNDKLLIFTEYKDTAVYIAAALAAGGVERVGVATGETDDPTSIAQRFAPRSNRLPGASGDDPEDELRVLVATDVLSEGQNLQDAHIVVNYDLPWAIIRLIQRAGRVDRVGQQSTTVRIYSFFHESVENVISLRQRIAARLAANAEAFGSDERFFGREDEVHAINDLYDGHLDEDDDSEVDAASLAYQHWIKALETDPDEAIRISHLPNLVHATRAKRISDRSEGIVCYVRTESGNDGFAIARADDDYNYLTAYETLQLMESSAAEPGLPERDDYDTLVRMLVRGPLAKPEIVAGRLRGVRRAVWNRLSGSLYEQTEGVSSALEALHQLPLRSDAERLLRKALKTHSLQDLAERIATLHARGALVIDSSAAHDPVRIVCTMGVTS